MPIKMARRVAGNRSFIIGISTHDLDQAVKAQKEGADYIGIGPIFSSKIKKEREPIGVEIIKKINDFYKW